MPEEALTRGQALLSEGKLREAQAAFYCALDGSGKSPEVAVRIADLWRKAGWPRVMGEARDPEAGYTCFHNARAILSKYDADGTLRAQVNRGLAIAAAHLGDHEEAAALALEGLGLTQDHGERCRLLSTRAIALNRLNRPKEARRCIREALRLKPDPKIRPLLVQTLGVAHILEGRPLAALPLVSHGLLRAWALCEADRWKQALKALEADANRGHLFRARALEGLGRKRAALKELIRGARAYEEGRTRLDTEVGRSTGGGTRQEVFGKLVDLCLELGDDRQAFAWIEAGRARSFLDFIVDGRRRDLTHLRPGERRRLERRRQEVERLRETPGEGLARAERELRMCLRRYEKEALASARIAPRTPLTARQISRALGRHEALIEYHVGPEQVHAFVLTRQGCRRMDLPMSASEAHETAADLERVVALARRDERMGRRGFFDWHLRVLAAGLLDPLGLDGIDRLIVVAHGPLHRIPFGALRPDLVVSLAPSASVHVTLARRAARLPLPRTCLLVKDPTGTLEHAGGEERVLRKRFGRGLTVLTGARATREAVIGKAPGHDVLHFATHAVFRPERPEFSYLELAHGERLHAFDVLDLDLRGTRLVTLAACESGRTDDARAGELIGLPRAFLRAGTPSVIATLWPIEDHPGMAHLMSSLYEGLAGTTSAGRGARDSPMSLWRALSFIGS
jgi:CHAT domain-containing protein